MLTVKNISFSYEENHVINNISFTVNTGENIAVIGESGSGKSTLLKLIYGEYDLDYGEISWKNNSILGPANNLVIGYDYMKYVAQEFDLMPFVSVEENVGKYLSNFFQDKKHQRINELLEVVELLPFSKTKVKLLSGGQKQRVALARALAKKPEIILLDEPFSHIDRRRIVVRDGEDFRLVRVDEVDAFEAAGNYVRIALPDTTWLVRGTLTEYEDRLDPGSFVRIHRSTIVNIDRVDRISPQLHGDFVVTLRSGRSYRMSRTHRHKVLP